MKKKQNKKTIIQYSLREIVYSYICEEMKLGQLSSDQYINQAKICEKLQISKAPLRDALIQLETEGFITILPRRGVHINPLTMEDIAEAYHVLAELESGAVHMAFNHFKQKHLKQMESLNEKMFQTLRSGKSTEYYRLNQDFHNIFLDLAGNRLVKKLVAPIKQRLYDFPLRDYNIEWEELNIAEHIRLMDSIRKGNKNAAVNIIKYEHWSFSLHKDYIIKFYEL